MVKDFYVSMKNPAGWKEYVQVNGGDAIGKGIQKAVNRALQQKRLNPVSS